MVQAQDYNQFNPAEEELKAMRERTNALSDLVHNTYAEVSQAANNNTHFGRELGEKLYQRLSKYVATKILGLEKGEITEGNAKYKNAAEGLIERITGLSKDRLVESFEGRTELHHSDLASIIEAVQEGVTKDAQNSAMDVLNDVKDLDILKGYAMHLAEKAGVTSLTQDKLFTKNAARGVILEMLLLLQRRYQNEEAAKNYRFQSLRDAA